MKSKVLVVVFDGCRPDALAQAHTPTVDQLWHTGAYSWSAQTVAPSVTLPTHTSMWRGVTPEKHGITENVFVPTASAYPSALEIAHRSGLSTAMFTCWEELRDLSAPGNLTMSYCHEAHTDDGTDQRVAGEAARYIVAEQPHLIFVYFGNIDLVGHDYGWMSDHYIAAIEQLDQTLGTLLQTLSGAHLREDYTLLFLADHGGHERWHGSTLREDLTIPWVINGPPIKQGHEIQTPVFIHDTAATIVYLLDLPLPDVWDGKPVLEAFVS
jgi:predicted AlkP superfamily pyrophosphatase or phosphodiesterase